MLIILAVLRNFFPSIWNDTFIIPLLEMRSKLLAICFNHSLQHFCTSVTFTFRYGLIKRRSTTTNLHELISFQGFQQNLQTDVIYTNFSKAFGSVDDSLIAQKLNLLGFPPKLPTDGTQMVLLPF